MFKQAVFDEPPWPQLVASLLLAALVPVGLAAPTLALAAAVGLVLVGLAGWETLSRRSHHWRQQRPVGERTPDLERVAEIVQEHTHPDGDIIGAEGELGEEMHILLDGTVRVVRGDGETIATGRGEVVGEMSVITRAPHVATLIAEGDVRTLHIGYREFEATGPRTAGHRPCRHARPGRAARGHDHPTHRGSGLSVRFSEPSPPGIG